MQRATTIVALVVTVTTAAITAATFNGSAQSAAPDRAAHMCPPAC